MELTNEFTVDVGVDEAWAVLTDLERIAPCMPGAQLQGVDGEDYRGVVKVKVGPITAEYRGKASFVERDPAAHRAVVRAEGRETRGQGNASATITATLEPKGTGTRASVVTDLTITGRVAQFGRGVLADVSNKLLGQFVASLESTVLAGAATGTDTGTGTGTEDTSATAAGSEDVAQGPEHNGAAAQPMAAVAPVDLVSVAGPAMLKRLLPVLAAALAVLAWWGRRRRRSSRSSRGSRGSRGR